MLSDKFVCATHALADFDNVIGSPYMRYVFDCGKKVRKAVFTVTGLGFYRFWMNGRELTKGYLSPYISNSDDIVDYDEYDITDDLRLGKNIFGFMLGNGMQNCFGGYIWDFEEAHFRSSPCLAFCLSAEYEDGTTEEYEADESVLCAEGPYFDDLRLGETYDAEKEIENWNSADFVPDGRWMPALKAESPCGEKRLCIAKPIVKTKELKPVGIWKQDVYLDREHGWLRGGYVYDFGENNAGIIRLKTTAEKGRRIEIYYGEHRAEDDRFYGENGENIVRKGDLTFLNDGLGSDKPGKPKYLQKDTYISAGKADGIFENSFTYHGFRYAYVLGITEEEAVLGLLTYIVMSTSLEEKGGFSCSDETVNKLQEMTRRSTLSNFYHFPTDCPQREKNGWTADASLSVEHTLLNLEPTENYLEWYGHIVKSQNEEGSIPGIIPTGGWGFKWGNGPAWDQIIVTLPYMLLRYRDDDRIAYLCCDTLIKYQSFLKSIRKENGLVEYGLGDWAPPDSVYHAPLIVTDSIISMEICRKTEFILRYCGKNAEADEARALKDDLRKAIRDNLIDTDTLTVLSENTETPGCQTCQAMALYYGVFNEDEEEKAFEVLLKKITENGDHLDTGVLGARVIFHVLTKFGHTDKALKIITDRTFPSYGNWVERGFTTLGELFASDAVFVGSANHHFFGDISAWFIKCLGGIVLNRDAGDFTRLDIEPHFAEKLDFADSFHITKFGKISSSWRRENGGVNLSLEIPNEFRGCITLGEGYSFSDGTLSKPLASGKYRIIKQ